VTLTAARLRELLHYDRATGVFTWRVRASSRAAAGDRAGFSREDGYRLIGIDGRIYLEHRLAWLYVTGEWPVNDVDHRDRDPSNNKWRNLRAATHSQNHFNRAKPANNTSGYKGVVWHKKCQMWQAQIKREGRNHYLGQFRSPEAAHQAYVAASRCLHGEFGRTE